jgi:hypothetical protein
VSGPQIALDFAGPRVRTTFAGALLLLVGLGALGAAGFEYLSATTRRAGLELKLAAALRNSNRQPVNTAVAARLNAEGTNLARELGAPWTALLSDLEMASQDSKGQIAVLAVEPDHDKHRVRISGESKDLAVALAYIDRLHESSSLRYPMLDSHEVVADDNAHPVRFTMSADWREMP